MGGLCSGGHGGGDVGQGGVYPGAPTHPPARIACTVLHAVSRRHHLGVVDRLVRPLYPCKALALLLAAWPPAPAPQPCSARDACGRTVMQVVQRRATRDQGIAEQRGELSSMGS